MVRRNTDLLFGGYMYIMTKAEVHTRKAICEFHDVCFITLKPFGEGMPKVAIEHEIAGTVYVSPLGWVDGRK